MTKVHTYPIAEVPRNELVLKRYEYAIQRHISAGLLRGTSMELSDVADLSARAAAVTLRKAIYGNPLGRIEYSFPASPWEHIRQAYFPKSRLGRWFLKRRPVRMAYHVASAAAMFPEAHMNYPEHLGEVTLLMPEQVRFTR